LHVRPRFPADLAGRGASPKLESVAHPKRRRALALETREGGAAILAALQPTTKGSEASCAV
jgi:hypothetical protein